MIEIIEEKMSGEFLKSHIKGLTYDAVFHQFSAPDKAGPHDHPFSFTSHVLCGGYIERVYLIDGGGGWRSELIHRPEGSVHYIAAAHIHEIVELPKGECHTLIIPGKKVREPRFWRFEENQIRSRAWNEEDFEKAV